MEAAKHASGHGTAVELCVDEIRSAIRVGVLMPGEHIKQSAIAESLGVSRIPIRDALSRLSADGVVAHTPNSGFKVAQLDIDELDQVYRMRELLETELLSQITPLSADVLSRVEAEHQAVCDAAASGDINGYHPHNDELHFLFFRMAGKSLILRQVTRLWHLAEIYRAVHVHDFDSRFRVLEEHEQIVVAARAGSVEATVTAFDAHRRAGREKVRSILLAREHMRAGGMCRITR